MLMRQTSKKLGNPLASGMGKQRQAAEHNGQAMYSRVQMVTWAEGLETRTLHPG